MYLLRVGRFRRWGFDRDPRRPEDVAEAARDLSLDAGEAGLSVFRVEGQDEAREVAARFALTCRPKPQHMDFVVFPSGLATDLGLDVACMPRDDLEPHLSARHHEILGLTDALALHLAAAILACDDRRVERVREGDLTALGMELCHRDPELRAFLRGDWRVTLLADPATGDDRGQPEQGG